MIVTVSKAELAVLLVSLSAFGGLCLEGMAYVVMYLSEHLAWVP